MSKVTLYSIFGGVVKVPQTLARNPEPKTLSPETKTPSPDLQALSPNIWPEIRCSKAETLNLKPWTRNLKSEVDG